MGIVNLYNVLQPMIEKRELFAPNSQPSSRAQNIISAEHFTDSSINFWHIHYFVWDAVHGRRR